MATSDINRALPPKEPRILSVKSEILLSIVSIIKAATSIDANTYLYLEEKFDIVSDSTNLKISIPYDIYLTSLYYSLSIIASVTQELTFLTNA